MPWTSVPDQMLIVDQVADVNLVFLELLTKVSKFGTEEHSLERFSSFRGLSECLWRKISKMWMGDVDGLASTQGV